MAHSSAGVLVTGASGGIGAATTLQLADAGVPVFAGYHDNPDGVPEHRLVTPVALDVTDVSSVCRAVDQIASAVGGDGLRAVINNAGLIVQGPLEVLPEASLRRQLEVNTLGPLFVLQQTLPLLRLGRGRIVNVSAPTARIPVPFLAPIGASKAALASWSVALRGELAPWRIPVVLIEPDATKTAIFDSAAALAERDLASATPARVDPYARQLAAIARTAAKQRMVEPDVVARVITKAATTSRPRRHYTAGPGARLFAMVSHLPESLRERVVLAAMGLTRAAHEQAATTV
jgi:NAD(P)-dependent dehydrogenase (short-subunit alcohol dehydrogenase family)